MLTVSRICTRSVAGWPDSILFFGID